MVINPNQVLPYLKYSSEINISTHIQQNGIDVDLDRLFICEPLILTNEISKKTSKEVFSGLIDIGHMVVENSFMLEKLCAYVFESSFEIEVPENMSGFLKTRSTLNRNQIFIQSGWYDSGYKGPIGGTIYCFNEAVISKNTRIAQLVMVQSEAASLYKGQYLNHQITQ